MNQNELAAKQKKRRQVITIIVLIIVFILFVIPFLLVLINVFKTKGDITSNPLALIGGTYSRTPQSSHSVQRF